MIDELINRFKKQIHIFSISHSVSWYHLYCRYYLEGEFWLMKMGIKAALSSTSPTASVTNAGSDDVVERDISQQLDQCFFVQQRCGQRAIATNNIQAACAVLHLISDLLSSDLLRQVTDTLTSSAAKVGGVLVEHMARYHLRSGGDTQGAESAAAQRLSKGIQSAISLASSIAIAGAATTTAVVSSTLKDREKVGNADREEGDDDDADDPWGVAAHMEAFNIAELCGKYTDRLGRDLTEAGRTVFGGDAGSNASFEKLRLCKDDFDTAKNAFYRVGDLCLLLIDYFR